LNKINWNGELKRLPRLQFGQESKERKCFPLSLKQDQKLLKKDIWLQKEPIVTLFKKYRTERMEKQS